MGIRWRRLTLLAVPEVCVGWSLALCSYRRHHARVNVAWEGLVEKKKIDKVGILGKDQGGCQDLLQPLGSS